jgi:YVTN family beta-propeller protein
VVDLAARATATTIAVGHDPRTVVVDQRAHAAYVLNAGDGSLSTLDTDRDVVTTTVRIGPGARDFTLDPADHTRYALGAGDSGGYAVQVVGPNGPVASVPLAHSPGSLALDPAAHALYVTDPLDNTVTVLDTDARAVLATVPVGPVPGAVAVDPATHQVCVAGAGAAGRGSITILAPR